MNIANTNFGRTDEFSELCALSTSGSLTQEEWQRLERHIAQCPRCASQLAEYQSLASEGMAKVGALRFSSAEVGETPVWDRDAAKARMLSTVATGAVEPGMERSEPAKSTLLQNTFARIDDFVRVRRAMPVLRFAAVLILAVLLAYETGLRRASSVKRVSANRPKLRKQLCDGNWRMCKRKGPP